MYCRLQLFLRTCSARSSTISQSAIMSADNDDYEYIDYVSLLPWQLIGEFLTLPEILNIRLVSSEMIDPIHSLSPQKCAALLAEALRANNMHMVPFGTWDNAVQDEASIANAFIRDGHEDTTYLDALMRCIRVIKSIPMEVAVAFNGKYGRHCIPLEWNDETNQTEPKVFEPCQRTKCRTCKLKIPTNVDANAKIHSFIQVQNKRGQPLDLTHFYNKCVPNLPPKIKCPACRCSDKRTLVLSTVSYPSSAPAGRNTLLTFTPRSTEHDDASVAANSGSDTETDDEEDEPPPKKQRVAQQPDEDNDSFAFPSAAYDDLSLPTKWEPLERDNTAKHVIAIHCVACRKFGILAPAGPCCDERYPCQERERTVTIGERAATIGGVFSRRNCSSRDCLHPISCEACSRQVLHPVHGVELHNRNDLSEANRQVEHKTRCLPCNLRFCNECAWQATVCHHW